jgi:hypothetical protein
MIKNALFFGGGFNIVSNCGNAKERREPFAVIRTTKAIKVTRRTLLIL